MAKVVRGAFVLMITALSVLFGVGCVLAALFELQGFGGPRDQGPRWLYLASLAVGFAACVAAPLAARKLSRRSADAQPDPEG